jgi:hypothetical protein
VAAATAFAAGGADPASRRGVVDRLMLGADLTGVGACGVMTVDINDRRLASMLAEGFDTPARRAAGVTSVRLAAPRSWLEGAQRSHARHDTSPLARLIGTTATRSRGDAVGLGVTARDAWRDTRGLPAVDGQLHFDNRQWIVEAVAAGWAAPRPGVEAAEPIPLGAIETIKRGCQDLARPGGPGLGAGPAPAGQVWRYATTGRLGGAAGWEEACPSVLEAWASAWTAFREARRLLGDDAIRSLSGPGGRIAPEMLRRLEVAPVPGLGGAGGQLWAATIGEPTSDRDAVAQARGISSEPRLAVRQAVEGGLDTALRNSAWHCLPDRPAPVGPGVAPGFGALKVGL